MLTGHINLKSLGLMQEPVVQMYETFREYVAIATPVVLVSS